MLQSIAGLGILVFSLLLSTTGAARPLVEEVTVNGFTVYLVDVQKGNQLGYVFGVPYGSTDDEPAQFGRAHFFEHMYSRGSTLYPGHETLIQAMTGFGFERNASTAMGRTSYYGIGLEDHALEAMRMHLAPLHGIELSASSLAREKATVINEIVTSAPNRPVRSVWAIPFMYATEANHPSRGQFTGTDETLKPMSDTDLRELHARIYHAGNVRLAIIGNFTSGQWKRDDIVQSLKTSLPSLKESPARYKPQVFAPPFKTDRRIDIQLKSERSGYLYLPIAAGTDIRDIHALSALLNGHARNGLRDVGLSQRGWLTSVNVSNMRIAGQGYLNISFDLTDKGYAQREEVAQWLMDAVQKTASVEMPPEIYSARREEILMEATTSLENVDKLVHAYAEWLTNDGYSDHVKLQWEKAVEHYNPASVRRGAQAIEMKNRAIIFLGSEEAKGSQLDPFFGRPFHVSAWQPVTVQAPAFDPAKVQLPQLTLSPAITTGELLTQTKWEHAPGWNFLHGFRAEWNDRTVILRIQPPLLTPRKAAALSALVYTVYNKLLPEIEVLARQGISLGIEIEDGALQIASTGSNGLEFSALEWVVRQLENARITATDLDNYVADLVLKSAGAEQGFPGSIADKVVSDLISPRWISIEAMLKAALSLDAPSVHSQTRALLKRTDKSLSVAGAYRQQEVYQLMSAVAEISPRALQAQPPKGRWITSTATYTEAWQDESSRGLGIARILNGPSPDDLREQMAVRLIIASLSEQVFLRNRPYGYVQNVSRLPYARDRQHIRFLGQAESLAELDGLQAVWDEEASRWVDGTFSDADLEKSRSNLAAMFSRQSPESHEGAATLLTFLDSTGDPFRWEKLAELVPQITRDEVIAAARKYLSPGTPGLTIIKGLGDPVSCEDLLTARRKVKRTL